jgi:hypothetical protein
MARDNVAPERPSRNIIPDSYHLADCRQARKKIWITLDPAGVWS